MILDSDKSYIYKKRRNQFVHDSRFSDKVVGWSDIIKEKVIMYRVSQKKFGFVLLL